MKTPDLMQALLTLAKSLKMRTLQQMFGRHPNHLNNKGVEDELGLVY